MAKKSTFKSNWPKYLLQWGVLALLVFFLSGLASLVFTDMNAPDPEKYCPFGGLEALGTYFANGSLPCSMTSMQIAMGVVRQSCFSASCSAAISVPSEQWRIF